jgi:dolichyl-phosphate beta-glucosyltransferase
MLQAAHNYFETISIQKKLGKGTIEWIVVSDGSTDQTERVYRELCQQNWRKPYMYKFIRLKRNSGKGAAVQVGMLHTQGKLRLMVDADGATEFGKGLEALLSELQPNIHLVWGSRSQIESRNVVRQALMNGFHFCTVVLVNADEIQDTQCGFKLFTDEVAQLLFSTLHLRRWAFDTELVYLAKRLRYTIREVNVPWHEVEGSKLHTSAFNLALVAVGMLRDMICVRLCYTIGLWKVKQKDE